MTDHVHSIDLASRAVGGSVLYTNDEFFVEKENLIKPEEPVSCKGQSGNRGGIYDGWETRRRRDGGNDWVIIRLGIPGTIDSVTVDTAFFRGNYPDQVSLEACSLPGYPNTEDVLDPTVEWTELVPRTSCEGDSENVYEVENTHSFTHVRLHIYPDGGVARLRVNGQPVIDPQDVSNLSFDLAALANGGRVINQSDNFFNPASNVIMSGVARTTKDGWETKRRRGPGNDWLTVQLAGPARLRQIGLDTSRYIGNSPAQFAVYACDARTDSLDDAQSWWQVLPKTDVHADILQRYRVDDDREATHVRLEIFPDGALARFHVIGELSDSGAEEVGLRWINSMGESHLAAALENAGASDASIRSLLSSRPFAHSSDIARHVDGSDLVAVQSRTGLTQGLTREVVEV
jgi:allantoicase